MSAGSRRPDLPLGLALMAAIIVLSAGDGRAQGAPSVGSAPIEITADTLEVRQNRRIATFTGEVDAVQGDLVLSADQLRVHYRGDAEVGQAGPGGTSIRRIEAFGNVFLSSPEETAQGDAGVYEVATRTVTLEGSVVLTKGQNVIRGERLEYNLATGRSQVFAQPKQDQVVGADGRVRAVFVPGGDDAAGPAEGADGGGNRRPAERGEAPEAASAPAGAVAEGNDTRAATWPPRPPQPKPALDG